MTAAPANGLQILVVEDESMIAILLEDMIYGIGHQVAGFASRVRDAMEKTAALNFDLAVLDVNLGGELSYPIAEELEKRGIPFIFATGYGKNGVPDRFNGVPVLAKPFEKNDLKLALDKAFAGGPELQ